MSSLDPGKRTGFEEALNALVPEASDHLEIVVRGATRSNFCETLAESSNPRPQQNLIYFDLSKLAKRRACKPGGGRGAARSEAR